MIPSIRNSFKVAGASTADKYLDRFESLFELLAEYPESGSRRRSFGKDIRIRVVFPYVAIYRYRDADDTVTVLRVIHGRRNITARMISG